MSDQARKTSGNDLEERDVDPRERDIRVRGFTQKGNIIPAEPSRRMSIESERRYKGSRNSSEMPTSTTPCG